MIGKLRLVAKEAKLTHDTEFGGKMDPFCVMKINNIEKKTKVLDDAGKVPKWEESFEFQAKIGDILSFIVYDEDKIGNDLVGQGSFSITELYLNNKTLSWLPITYDKNKAAGEVYFEIEFIPEPEKPADVPGEIPQKSEEYIKELPKSNNALAEIQGKMKGLLEIIENERDKRSENQGIPVPQEKKKEDPAVKASLDQIKKEIDSAKKFLETFDVTMASTIAQYKSYVADQNEWKRSLHITNEELEYLKNHVIPGKITLNLKKAEFKPQLTEIRIAVICGEQKNDVKKKKDAQKGWEFNESVFFNITNQNTIVFLILTPENQLLGIGGLGLYPYLHSKSLEEHAVKLKGKDEELGEILIEIAFKGE